MPPSTGHSPTSPRSRQRSPEARSPTSSDDGSFTMDSDTEQSGKGFVLNLPVEIILAILLEWMMMEWFAPAIARRVCRYFKEITDSSPNIWSTLSLPYHSAATADGVRSWLNRAKSVPKRIYIDTENIDSTLAALEYAKDATSIVCRITDFKTILPYQEEQIRIRFRIRMPQLRHLYLDSRTIYNILSLGNTGVRSYDPLHGGHFPCLTILHLLFVDLMKVRIIPGFLPAIRRLVLRLVHGPILDLVQVCSGTLEHLAIINSSMHKRNPYPHDRICLPNLKALIVADALGIVPNLEAPTLRLLSADLAEINGSTMLFSTVVEWLTYPYYSGPFEDVDITEHLANMPKLQHLVILHSKGTLKQCFASLSRNPWMCPYLQTVEVMEFGTMMRRPEFAYPLWDFVRMQMAGRQRDVPGFTLECMQDDDRVITLHRYYLGDYSSFEGAMKTFETEPPLSFRGLTTGTAI